MTDLANIETAAKQEVASVKSKVVAFVLANRAVISGVVSFIAGVVLGHKL